MMKELSLDDIAVTYGLDTARIGDRPFVQRRLSDLKGCFVDTDAYEKSLELEDPVLYEVTAIEPANGEGQLHWGLGILYPGKIGNEYYMTKGHYHSFRPAAEVYVGLKGSGMMLLEDEESGESRMVALGENQVVYVPGHTAHRTMNIGEDPLVYLGIYPSNAGHDYGSIADRNFNQVVVDIEGSPHMQARNEESK